MIKEIELAILPEQHLDMNIIKDEASKLLKIDDKRLTHIHLLKRSIDARGRQVLYRLKIKVYIDEQPIPEVFSIKYPNVSSQKPVLIIGAGPAGLFAALRCIENGLKPIILERGKDV